MAILGVELLRRSRGVLLAVAVVVGVPLAGSATAFASEPGAQVPAKSTVGTSSSNSGAEESWVSLSSEPSERAGELAENPGAASRARLREPVAVAACVVAAGAANGSRTLIARQPVYYPVAQGSFRKSSDYGFRLHPVMGTWKLHSGTDFSAPQGTPIYAVADGVVVSAGYNSHGGNMTEIKHELEDGTIVVSAYLHQSRLLVSEGDSVAAGQQIGEVGNTGVSTGAHLHLEIRDEEGTTVDPLPWLTAQEAVYVGQDCQ